MMKIDNTCPCTGCGWELASQTCCDFQRLLAREFCRCARKRIAKERRLRPIYQYATLVTPPADVPEAPGSLMAATRDGKSERDGLSLLRTCLGALDPPIMAARSQALSLYKRLCRSAERLPRVDKLSQKVKQNIRIMFYIHRSETDADKIDRLLDQARADETFLTNFGAQPEKIVAEMLRKVPKQQPFPN